MTQHRVVFIGSGSSTRRRDCRFNALWTPVASAIVWLCAGGSAWACEGPAAKLVSMEGTVEIRPAGSGAWRTATAAQALCTGDTVAVRALSRAAVVLPNEVLLRLDQGAVLTLKSFTNDQASELGLLQGALHVLTRFSKRFGVVTPYMNAMVDGTEFTVKVSQEATSVSVDEGQVRAENSAGMQTLKAGASAQAVQGQAPQVLSLRPLDAVQWAMYFPPIVRVPPSAIASLPATAQQAIQAAAQGQYGQAVATWPAELNLFRSERAGWLLGIGRVEEAEALLDGDDRATASAVRALIQVVRNQTDAAWASAQQAIAREPGSAAAQLALSYVLQARRDLPAALAAAQKAVTLESDHPLAWARLSELQLSSGLLREGERSAQQALALNARAPRASTLLGFAQLLRGRHAQALESLQAAQAQAPSDPLPHLGLGLVLLRQGAVAEGRREMEIAVMLDPGDAELRSALARAYLREQRDRLAATELGVARELDPRSPTPWFIEGQRKQAAHRPVEAAADYERALALNQQRAVIRPNSLLDTDRASRTAALASVWRELGFDGATLSAARRALLDDPQNEAAHRLLAQAYAASPRYETARVSELLQAQLRQSPRTEPVAPQDLVPGLPVLNGPRVLALQETGPLFDERGGGARLGLMAGGNGLFGSSATAWRSVGDGQLSFGHFHYETDGFRDGADVKLDTNNVLWQTALTPEWNVQAEVRRTQKEGGDITQRLFPESAAPVRQRSFDSDIYRLGTRYATGPDSEWLGSLVRVQRDDLSIDTTRSGRQSLVTQGNNDRSGWLSEVGYGSRTGALKWNAGISKYREDSAVSTTISSVPVVRPPIVRQSNPLLEHDLAFVYATLDTHSVAWHWGLSQDDFSKGPISVHQLSPKAGLSWPVAEGLQLRAAFFQSVKGSVAKEQSIEPTQFAGFNQVFDDSNGTQSQRTALALESTRHAATQWGLEWSRRRLDVPTSLTTPIPGCPSTVCDVRWKELSNKLYVNHRIDRAWALNAELSYETQSLYTQSVATSLPVSIRTWQLPLKLSYFNPSAWSVYGQGRAVQQNGHATTGTVRDARDSFVLIDTGLRYRLSDRSSMVVDVANVFDRSFQFQDTYLSGEPRVPLFQPRRTIAMRLEVRL